MKTELFEMVDMDYLFTVITADRAVEYTGKKVYVADSIIALEKRIKEGTTRTLEGINSNLCELRFNVHNDDCTTTAYALCVPADKVIKREKQLRPFKTLKEFCDALGIYGVGDSVRLRFKLEPSLNYIMTFNGYAEDEEKRLKGVSLGSDTYTVQHLFNNFEYYLDKDQWHPFGVEE